jgi:hypothetical protein
MWRLQNGNLFVRNQPRVIVVLIGTNDLACSFGDLSSTATADEVATRLYSLAP